MLLSTSVIASMVALTSATTSGTFTTNPAEVIQLVWYKHGQWVYTKAAISDSGASYTGNGRAEDIYAVRVLTERDDVQCNLRFDSEGDNVPVVSYKYELKFQTPAVVTGIKCYLI